MAYAPARTVDFDEIPVIDVAALRGGADGALRDTAAAILDACATAGFFYVRGHGVPASLREAALAEARAFFALSAEDKAKVAVDARHRGYLGFGGAKMYTGARPDLKESYNWGLELAADDPAVARFPGLMGPNRWPDGRPGFRTALYAYYEAVLACGADLLRAVAIGLDLPTDFFRQRYDRPIARGSILHYPPQPPDLGEEQFGVGAHTDYGCLTLLWQDEVGGLQVRNRAGDWIAAPPVADSLVINVGDLLARWSNDRLVSTPHRVVNSSGRERYSIAVFYDPDGAAIVDPRDANPDPAAEIRYPPVGAGDHIQARFDAAFAYRARKSGERPGTDGSPC